MMAMYAGATPKLIKYNFGKSGMSKEIRGLVVHIAQSSTLAGVYSWFNNPRQTYKDKKGVDRPTTSSAHFGVDKDGTIWQFVDTDHMAYAQGPGNAKWISVENVGYSGKELTEEQLLSLGNLLYWLNEIKTVPLMLASSSASSGVAYHSIDPSWGHPLCPGDPIKAQLQRIVDYAKYGF